MKKIYILGAISTTFLYALPASARIGGLVNQGFNYASVTGLSSRDLREVIFLVVNVLLGFLSIIAVIGILYGGFMYMTSGGNEDRADSGKKAIYAGLIGLIIIFTAFAIANFVIRSLINVTGAG